MSRVQRQRTPLIVVLRTGRETQVATRTAAAELLAGMVTADSALTVAGAL